MPSDQTIDFVVMFLVLGLLTTLFISVGIGALVRQWDRLMSRSAGGSVAQSGNENRAEKAEATKTATSNNALQSDATYSKGLLDGQARALAIAVRAGKYGETEGLKAVFGVSPSSTNARYIAARAALKAELARLDNPYPALAAQQRPSIVERN